MINFYKDMMMMMMNRDGVKRCADSGLQFTHKSCGHWSSEEEGAASWVSDGVVCGERNANFSSADWMAVDCPCCLVKKTPISGGASKKSL